MSRKAKKRLTASPLIVMRFGASHIGIKLTTHCHLKHISIEVGTYALMYVSLSFSGYSVHSSIDTSGPGEFYFSQGEGNESPGDVT